MTEACSRDLNAAQIVAICTLPMLGTLLFVAFGVVERAQVDPAVTVFWDRSHGGLPDVWYAGLIVFGCLHAAGMLAYHRGEIGLRAVLMSFSLAPFIALNLLNLPVEIAKLPALLLAATIIGIIIAFPGAIAVAGAIFGLLLFLPVYHATGQLMRGDPREVAGLRRIYIWGGVFAAFVFFSGFGLDGSSTQRIGVGQTILNPAHPPAAWLYVGIHIALCCAGFCLGHTYFWQRKDLPTIRRFAIWFVAPIAAFIVAMGPVLTVLAQNPTYHWLAATKPLSKLSFFFREGVPLRTEQLLFKGGAWSMPRERISRIGYMNGSAFAWRLEIRPRTEHAIIGQIELSPHRRNPETSRALDKVACGLDKGQMLLICQRFDSHRRIPGTTSYFPQSDQVIEVDSESPAREMQYDAFEPQFCKVRLSDIGGLGFSAEFRLDCSKRQSWRQIAADVETELAASYQGKPAPTS